VPTIGWGGHLLLKCPETLRWTEKHLRSTWPHINGKVAIKKIVTDKNDTQQRNLDLDGWLAVLRSITLVDFKLDAQNSYLFTYNIFIKIIYMFRTLPCSSSGGLRRNCKYVASGIVTLCR
jgi:hypothetical protein